MMPEDIEKYKEAIRNFIASIREKMRASDALWSAAEVLFIATISCLPLLGSFIIVTYDTTENITIGQLVLGMTGQGQLWLYSISTAATVFWLSIHCSSRGLRAAGSAFSAILLFVVAVILTKDQNLHGMKNPTYIKFSIVSFLVINAMYFLVILATKQQPHPPSVSSTLQAGVSTLRQEVEEIKNT